MIIKILESGCNKRLKLNGNIEKITDGVAKARFGIMSTPGLVMNGQVATSGHVLNASEIGQLLAQGS